MAQKKFRVDEITQVNKTVIPCFVLPLICCRLFSLLSFYPILFMTEKYAKGPGTRKFQSTFSLFRNRKRYPSVEKVLPLELSV